MLGGDPDPYQTPNELSFEPNGRILAARNRRGLKFWDSDTAEMLKDVTDLGWSGPRFEEDGTLLTFGPTGVIRWPMRREGPRYDLGPPRLELDCRANGMNLSSSKDGQTLLIAVPGYPATILSGEPPGRLASLAPQDDVRGGSLSPDGRWAATGSYFGPEVGIIIWESKTGRRVTALKVPNHSAALFSPDGRWIVTNNERTCHLWEVGTWRLVREIEVESGPITFSATVRCLRFVHATRCSPPRPRHGSPVGDTRHSKPGHPALADVHQR